MSALGTVSDHMTQGFTQAEAEALEVVVRACDHSVEQAALIGDEVARGAAGRIAIHR